jgi:hypothetical protein
VASTLRPRPASHEQTKKTKAMASESNFGAMALIPRSSDTNTALNQHDLQAIASMASISRSSVPIIASNRRHV